MNEPHRLVAILAAICATSLPAQDAGTPRLEQRLAGTWSAEESGQVLRFDGELCVVAHALQQTLLRVRYDDAASSIARHVLGNPDGVIEASLTFADDEHVTLVGRDGTLTLTRVAGPEDEVPEAVRIEPLPLGQRELDAAEIERIGADLTTRRDREQAIRQELSEVEEGVRERYAEDGIAEDPFRAPEVQAVLARMKAIDDANTRYLKDLLTDVGWIDADRFGDGANGAAFLIVQHCGNIAMLESVLAAMKAEFDAGHAASGQRYALMYDRLTLSRGGEQRYGSQLHGKPDGSLYFPRLEDPANVDARRAEVGLGTLAEYAKRFGSAPVELPAGYDAGR